jgi:hypothetical protein
MAIELLICMWLLAIELLYVAGFGNLLLQGRCSQNFKWTLISLLFCRRRTCPTPVIFLVVLGLPAPRRLATAPSHHGPASLTPPPPLV